MTQKQKDTDRNFIESYSKQNTQQATCPESSSSWLGRGMSRDGPRSELGGQSNQTK